MFTTVVSINGKLVPISKAAVSVFDNSLLYAEGLFETFLGIDNRAIFEREHLNRLHRGAKVIGLTIPVSRGQLSKWIRQALAAHPHQIKQLRLTVTAGNSARWYGQPGQPQIIILVAPHQLPVRPARLIVSPFRVDQNSIFRRIKTISYAIQAAAVKQARQRKYDDALMLNERGQVAEITSANICWVKRGTIYTPPLGAGCLEGTTREVIFREAPRAGVRIREKAVSLSQMLSAEEIFISSSTRLVVAVGEIADKRRHLFQPGPVTEALRQHFLKLVGLSP